MADDLARFVEAHWSSRKALRPTCGSRPNLVIGHLRWFLVSFPVIDLAATSWHRGECEPGGDESKRWFIPLQVSDL